MNIFQKKYLLTIARDSITAALKGSRYEPPLTDDFELQKHLGCFVTLKTHDQLRGCLGVFTSDKPLYEMVAVMARESATLDPRFSMNRLMIEELKYLDIEISVLSELQKTSDPLSLELGLHGIYIKKDYSAGCLLPQVATESGWSKEEFLTYCCAYKAGLASDAWKHSDTEVYLFTADVFGDKDVS